MRMHPVCPNLICKIWSIIECVTRWYSAIINSMHSRVLPLSDPINPIKVGSSRLVNSMCVDGDILDIIVDSGIVEIIEDPKSIVRALVNDQRTNWPVTVDTDDGTTNSIWTSCHPRDIPINQLCGAGGCEDGNPKERPHGETGRKE